MLLAGAAALGCATGCAAQPGPSGAAAVHLYWANSHNGTIVEANLDGSHANTIAEGQYGPAGVAASP